MTTARAALRGAVRVVAINTNLEEDYMKPVQLTTEPTAYANLHQASSGRGKTARVIKEDLAALLLDHGRVLARLQELGVETVETWK